jgi:hypothetical protein
MADEEAHREGDGGSDYSTYLRAYIRTLVDQTVRARALPRRERTLWLAARAAWDANQDNAPLSRSKLESYLRKAGFEV